MSASEGAFMIDVDPSYLSPAEIRNFSYLVTPLEFWAHPLHLWVVLDPSYLSPTEIRNFSYLVTPLDFWAHPLPLGVVLDPLSYLSYLILSYFLSSYLISTDKIRISYHIL